MIGLSDFVATVGESPYLVGMVNRMHPGRATLARIEGMDHYLSRAATMAESVARQDRGEFHPEALSVTLRWMEEQVRKAG